MLEQSKGDVVYQRLHQQVLEGTMRRYWFENDLLFAQGLPSRHLQHVLLREVLDAKWAGHPGREKTLMLLARSYYWPKMEREVEAYVKSCMVYQLNKTEIRKEAGLLQPLLTPERPWQSTSMDFISGF